MSGTLHPLLHLLLTTTQDTAIVPFYRLANWGSQRLSNLTKFVHVVSEQQFEYRLLTTQFYFYGIWGRHLTWRGGQVYFGAKKVQGDQRKLDMVLIICMSDFLWPKLIKGYILEPFRNFSESCRSEFFALWISNTISGNSDW